MRAASLVDHPAPGAGSGGGIKPHRAHLRLLPRERLRADQQLRRDRRRAAPPRASGRVHRRALVRGNAGREGIRGAAGRLAPPAEGDEDPGQFWKDFIRDTAPVFRKPTIEQLEGFIAPTFEALCDGARYVDEQLVEILAEVGPDVIVEDNVVSFPALPASGRPWVRIVSCNPAEVKDAQVPPPFSGYPTADRTGWEAYMEEYARALGPLQRAFDEFCRERGAPPLGELEFIHTSDG